MEQVLRDPKDLHDRPETAATPSLLERLDAPVADGMDDQMAALSPEMRKTVLTEAGKETARIMASGVLAQMLAETRVSQRELDDTYGFDHTALSKAARGVGSRTGPQLWKLIALADALGYRIELTAKRK